MSDLIESIKQGAGQVLSELDQKGQLRSAIDGIRSQWNELERRRKKSSLESQVKSMRVEMKQLAEALGLQTLSLYEAGKIAHPELARLCERISELRTDIDEIKKTLAELEERAAKRATPKAHCALCHAEIEANADFCPKCGARLKAQPAQETSPKEPRKRATVRTRCPRCKTEVSPDAAFCPGCGAKFRRAQTTVPSSAQFCPSCGAEARPNAQFCPICGQKIG